MTDSRETMRRRAFRERSDSNLKNVERKLTELCIIDGCIALRVGSNLCRPHDRESDQ